MTPLLIFLLALLLILVLTALFRFNPFLSLLSVSLLVALLAAKPFEGLQAILTGMERVIYQFGIIIVCGSIIGIVLDGIGGIAVIADDIIRLSKEPILALNLLGFIVAIPVMCCILAYVIFIPIARAIASKLKIPIGVAAASLSLGTLASYELIYPAPGVYSAAVELGIVGRDIVLLGLFIAIPTSMAGYLYAKRFCQLGPVPPDVVAKQGKRTSRLQAYPPIIVPLLLIFLSLLYPIPVLNFAGDPNVALLIGVFLVLIAAQGSGRDTINTWTREAVKKGGGILMVLCSGGALASTLAITGVGQEIGAVIVRSGMPALLVPFMVAVAIQSVQGSRLVTFLIAPSIIQPTLPELGLPLELVLMSMASGTFLVSHANDAYFWAVIELAEMTPAAGYRCYTIGGIVLGAVALLITALIYLVG
ncbi:MAG: GntP family permease [Methanophagales archaeon ANME-1-THS]|nr:MAG: GntP family permease [Methanophagales archaeon ANME-1-THS]